jgi:ACS family pantothenate transporter-like MFS transporter
VIYWLRSYNKPGAPPVYSVTQINLIPLGVSVSNLSYIQLRAWPRAARGVVPDWQLNGLIIVGALIADWISDNLPGSARWPIMAFCCSWGSVMGIALAASPVYPDNRSIRMALYCE